MKTSKQKLTIIIPILIIAFVTSAALAKNLGTWGTVFPIEEQDIKEFIYERLNHMKQNGELEKINTTFMKNTKKHMLRPTPVANITTTDQPKIFYYDPIYTLIKNIEDEKGKVIVKAGTTVNPLDTIKLHGVLFFINADDKKQINWAITTTKRYEYVKYILVKGNIKTAGEVLNKRIYFDQNGNLTKQLGIKHVPCVVKQSGKKLEIQEFSLKK